MHLAAIFLGHSPERVVAAGETANGVDVNTGIMMKYKNGAIANLTTSLTAPKPATAQIFGTMGSITIPDFYSSSYFNNIIYGWIHKTPPN